MDKKKSLEPVVGTEMYSTWVAMLRSLVPQGRTHRLAPLIADMLQYAYNEVYNEYGTDTEADTIEHAVVLASEAHSVNEASEYIGESLHKLFTDAGVRSKRVNARGQGYSVAQSALYEFINWYAMPWKR